MTTKSRLFLLYWLVPLVIVAMIASCNMQDLQFDKVKSTDLKPTWKFTLGEVNYTVAELVGQLDDTVLQVSPSEGEKALVKLSYVDSIDFTGLNDVVTIETSITSSFQFNTQSAAPSLPNQDLTSDIRDLNPSGGFLEFETGTNEKIEFIQFNNGNLVLTVTKNENVTVDYTLTFTDLKNSSTQESMIFSALQDGVDPVIFNRTLDGNELTLNDGGVDGTTKVFTVAIQGTVTIPAGGTGLNAGDMILSFDVNFQDVGYSYVQGKFGRDTVKMAPLNINLDFFKDLTPNVFQFENPTLEFFYTNTFGMEFKINMDSVLTAKRETDDSVVLAFYDSLSDRFIPETILTYEIFDCDTAINCFSDQERSFTPNINGQNSNLPEFLNLLPTSIATDSITGFTNPSNSNTTNALTPNSKVDGIFKFTLPLQLKVTGYTQSFDFDLSGSPEVENVDSIGILITTYNELPLNTFLRIKILKNVGDTTETIYEVFSADDSVRVLDLPAFPNAATDRPPKVTETFVLFDEEGNDALNNGDKFFVEVVAYSHELEDIAEDEGYVQFYSSNELRVQVSAVAYVSVNPF